MVPVRYAMLAWLSLAAPGAGYGSGVCSSPPQHGRPYAWEIQDARRQLRESVEADQRITQEYGELYKNSPQHPQLQSLDRRFRENARRNAEGLRVILGQWGWPMISVFGPEADSDAWLILQHANHDPELQKDCLELLKRLAEVQETAIQNVPSLTDRIAINEGRPQIYGTYGRTSILECWEPHPVEDPERVDERRARYGLGSLEEYRKAINRHHGLAGCDGYQKGQTQ